RNSRHLPGAPRLEHRYSGEMVTRQAAARAPSLQTVGVVLAAGLAVAYVALGASMPWDFDTYYYAAAAYRSGLDPYSLGALSSVAGKPIELPFVYPPVTLALFAPLADLPLAVARVVWLALNSIAAVLLLLLWRREFLQRFSASLVVTIALLGFDVALLWNL